MANHNNCQTILNRLKTDRDDLRHTVLEMSAPFLAAVEDAIKDQGSKLNAGLKREIDEIAAEVKAVQPQFPSHRKTSVLFDREGMGIPGHNRAKKLAMRMIAVLKALMPAE